MGLATATWLERAGVHPGISLGFGLLAVLVVLAVLLAWCAELEARQECSALVGRGRMKPGVGRGSVGFMIRLVSCSYGAAVVEVVSEAPGRVKFVARGIPWPRRVALWWPPWRRAAARRVEQEKPAGVQVEVRLG